MALLEENLYPGRLSSTTRSRLSRNDMRRSISYVNIIVDITLFFVHFTPEGAFIAQNGICANLSTQQSVNVTGEKE